MKQTPLFESHKKLGGKIVDFGGWALPIEYEGIFPEYDAVRNSAGLFDVSHMGEYLVNGPGSEAFIQKIITNDISKISDARLQYSPMCYSNGGTVDDVIVYRFGPDEFLIVVNAANCEKDGKWFEENLFGETMLENRSDETAQLALQGPKAQEILQKLTSENLSELKFFRFKNDVEIAGVKVLISRSGYTGEDGFELYLPTENAVPLWNAILYAGKDIGVKPAGLGARDLLRFEACLPLYGQEISETISPLCAGLDRFIKLEKECDFNGKEALQAEKESGSPRVLLAFEMKDRAVPRSHYPILSTAGEVIGEVTHGTFSPARQKSIGLGYVKSGSLKIGDELGISIRNKTWSATAIEKPFYTKKYAK